MQSTQEDILFGKKNKNLIKYETPDGVVYLERGISLDAVTSKRRTPVFSSFLADIICEKIVNELTIEEICQELKITKRTFGIWRRDNEEFSKDLDESYKMRALILSDKLMKSAEDGTDTSRDKLKMDAYKWLAEKGDAENFGTKTKIIGDKNAPLVFAIETGIRRSTDDGFEEPENPLGERSVGPIVDNVDALDEGPVFQEEDVSDEA